MDLTITLGSWAIPLAITVIGFIVASIKGKADSTPGLMGDLPWAFNMVVWLIGSLVSWLIWALILLYLK